MSQPMSFETFRRLVESGAYGRATITDRPVSGGTSRTTTITPTSSGVTRTTTTSQYVSRPTTSQQVSSPTTPTPSPQPITATSGSTYWIDPQTGVRREQFDSRVPEGMVQISKSEFDSLTYDRQKGQNVVATQQDLDQLQARVDQDYQERLAEAQKVTTPPVSRESIFTPTRPTQPMTTIGEVKGEITPMATRSEPMSVLTVAPEPQTARERLDRWIATTRTTALTQPSVTTGFKSFGAGVAQSGLMTLDFFKSIPSAAKAAAQYSPPSTGKNFLSALTDVSTQATPFVLPTIAATPALVSTGIAKGGQTIRTEPSFSLGFISSEVAQLVFGGKAIEKTVQTTQRVGTRLDPRFTPLTDEGIVVKSVSPERGTVTIGQAGPVSQIAEPLEKQVQLAGKNIDAVSAQRGLFSPLEKRKVVDKPLPTPDAPPLERAFFADPYSRVRVSRLGVTDTPQRATLEDIFTGNVQISRPKPQILLFEQAKVADIPTELSNVERKLRAGVTLTPAEESKFVDWQLTPTREFKPVGFLSKEPEVILAPGEIIQRRKTIGITEVGGVRTPIISAEIGQMSPALRKSLTQTDTISPTLTRQIAKETGFSPAEVSYKVTPQRPVLGLDVMSSPTVAATRTIRSPLSSPPVSRIVSSPPTYRPPTVSPPVSPSPISAPTSPFPSSPSPSVRPPVSPGISVSRAVSPPYRFSLGGGSPPVTRYDYSPPIGFSGEVTRPLRKLPKIDTDSRRTVKLEEDMFTPGRDFGFTPDIQAVIMGEKGVKPTRDVYSGIERRLLPRQNNLPGKDYIVQKRKRKNAVKSVKKVKRNPKLKPTTVFSRWKKQPWRGL